jgi:hypothetical protein
MYLRVYSCYKSMLLWVDRSDDDSSRPRLLFNITLGLSSVAGRTWISYLKSFNLMFCERYTYIWQRGDSWLVAPTP